MDETGRTTALKKAYAEIILNSAKEAAARVMLSERKACEYQRDLSATKEEALRLLMRVKMMMDNKINEVETKSLVQQRKIEELEAQLQEAEDIVSSLRAELSDAHAEVERLSRNPQQQNTIKKSVGKQTNNRVEEKGTLMPPSPESVAASTFKPNNLTLNHCSSEARHNSADNYLGNCSYVGKPDEPSKNTIKKSEGEQTDNRVEEKGTLMPPSPESLAASTFKPNNLTLNNCSSEARHNSANNYLGNCSYVGKPDEPSIFMRIKELYRKGCTQRIRASERNLSDGHRPIPGRLNNLQDGDKLIKEAKHHTTHCVLPSPGPGQKCMVEKQPAAVRSGKRLHVGPLVGAKQRHVAKEQAEVGEATNINVAVHNTLADSFHRKRKRGVRVRRSEMSLLKSVPVQIKEEFEAPNVSLSETCVADSLSNLSKFYNDEDEDNLNSNMKSSVPSDISKPAAPSESKYVADEDATKDDMELADSLVLMTQENAPRSDSVVKKLQTTLKSENDPSVNPADKFGGASDDIAYQLPKEKVLKYTFQRKRKKGALSSTDNNEGQQQENPSKKRPVKKQNCAVEDPKPSLVAESSRDSRRLAQVARQLISLSEKKWWT